LPVTSANDRTAVVETGTGPGATTELREYVYGPGDVDELTAVVDGTAPSRHVHYVLADGNANVMGLTTPAGDVVVQQQYTPYGEVAARDALVPEGQLPRCRAGHQGLFFYRCDGQPTDPALAPAAAGLYYNRNRWYSPQLGRPTTRDPNESALPLLIALAMQGDALDLVLGAFDAAGQFADGANLYGYLGANPINRRDPSGLSWEDDADFDDLISDLEGHRLYALGARNEGARWASLGLNTARSIASSLLGLDVFESVYLLSTGRGGFWDAMNIVASVNPGTRVLKVIGKAARYKLAANRLVVCVGDWHHAISKRIWRALESHPKLRNKYKHRDARFVTQAKDKAAHNGYDTFHRQVDAEVADEIRRHPDWTTSDFESYLQTRYSRNDAVEHFPHGLGYHGNK